jgi:CMP-N,N'-diacetyllegionaminic acid synthase
MKVVTLIPARGGSKRLPRKNIKNLCGSPLIDYAIQASLQSKVDETWVSTEDKEIKNVALKCGAKVLDRPAELASDTATTESVMAHFTEHVDYDIIILIEATYPLIQTQDINISLDKFIKTKCDSFLTLEQKKFFIWKLLNENETTPVNYNPQKRKRYQDFEGIYVEEGGIYMTTRKNFLKTQCRLNGKIGYYILQHPSIDIDTEIDFKIAEKLLP